MHITFKTRPKGGLKVIEEIEDYPICWLEGRNGAGKTLAFRLLEIATGGQPYASDTAAWKSLRKNLGPVEIKIDQLPGGERIELALTPDTWPDEPLLDVADHAALGTARLNDEDIHIRDVRKVVHVSRISGEETLTTSLRTIIARDRAIAIRQNAHLSATLNDLTMLDSDLFRPFASLSQDTMATLEKSITRTTAEVEEARRDLERSQRIVERLRTFERLTKALAALHAEGPALDKDLIQVEDDLTRLEHNRIDLADREKHLAPTAEQAGKWPNELQRLYRLYEKQDREWRTASMVANTILTPLGLPLETERVHKVEQEERVRRNTLKIKRNNLSYPSGLRQLIDQVRTSVATPPAQDLDTAVIAILNEIHVTSETLQDGLNLREEELRQYDPQVRDIDAQLEDLDARLVAIGEALVALKEMDSATQRRQTTEQRIKDTLSKIDAKDDYRRIVQDLNALDAKKYGLLELKVELSYKRAQLESEGAEKDLVAQTAKLRDELQLSAPIEEAINDADRETTRHHERLVTAQAEADHLRTSRKDAYKRLSKFAVLLHSDARYEWLRREVAALLPPPPISPDEALPQIERLLEAIEQFRADAQTIVVAGNIVQDALSYLVSSFDNAPSDAPIDETNRFLPPLTAHYQTQFGKFLAAKDIEKALFEEGTFKSLDLLRREVIWQVPTGETRRRPIEAFSSGERAFTYILATVLRLQQEAQSTRYRLLVLDEFGAFIEADRLDRLLHFLEQQVLGAKYANQVVIVLPLRTRSELLFASDDVVTRREEKQFNRRGYIIHDKVPG
jgi:peptidoglycan hydrolase CwlO-like protein